MIRDTLTDDQLSALLSAARANLEMQRIFGSAEVIGGTAEFGKNRTLS